MQRLDWNEKEAKRELLEIKRKAEEKEKEEKEKERKREEKRKEKEKAYLLELEAEIGWKCRGLKKETQQLVLMGKERQAVYYLDQGWLFVADGEPCFYFRHPDWGKHSIKGKEKFVERLAEFLRGS